MTNQKNEREVQLDAHLRAIEDAVQIANLDGSCNHADHVLYHANRVRELHEEIVRETEQQLQ